MKKFIKREDIQEALLNDNLDYVYEQAIEVDSYFPGVLTSFLLDEVGIDPMDYVNKIHTYMYAGCNIKEIKIENNIKEINWCAFEDCQELEKVFISDSVKVIAHSAFNQCENLQEIDLPKVLTIGSYAFSGCYKMRENGGYVHFRGTEEDYKKLTISIGNECLKTAYWEFDA